MGKLKARELAEGRQRTGEQQRLGPDLQALFSCIYEQSFPESQSPQPKCFGEWLVWICEASWEFAYKEDPSVSKRITFFFLGHVAFWPTLFPPNFDNDKVFFFVVFCFVFFLTTAAEQTSPNL